MAGRKLVLIDLGSVVKGAERAYTKTSILPLVWLLKIQVGMMQRFFFTCSEVLSPATKNWLIHNKLGLSKTFTSLSQPKDKVSPGSVFLDHSFLVV